MDWFGGESLFTPFLEAKEEIGDLRESEKKPEVFAKRQAGYCASTWLFACPEGLFISPRGVEQGQADRRDIVEKRPCGTERAQHHCLEFLAPEGSGRHCTT